MWLMLCVMQDEWPTEEEVQEFESGKKSWPCTTTPSLRCKCGIVATKGVVPSEFGYGYYCGNSYGKYWVRILTTKLKLLTIMSFC